MKRTIFLLISLMVGIAGYAQTYAPVSSKNKTFLQTVKGITYTYKNGTIYVKNNSAYSIGVLSITASSKTDSTLFGIVLFDEGLGKTAQQKVYFSKGLGKEEKEISLKEIDEKNLVFSIDRASRATQE
ncbi:hypothetical protein [Pedobacter nototheniae]|uniref:hypothetical protein n=1 Tax=Pedobacter nototheniae TaxID=2488994 RepID=UPI00292FBB39|nr:hypothetical protein [Pedobacter nototheniae]